MPAPLDSALFRLKASSPVRVLRSLVDQGRKTQRLEDLARVTVWTHAGASLSGRAVQLEARERTETLLLWADGAVGTDGKPGLRLTFVETADICAVSVEGAAKFAAALSEGDIPRPLGEVAPSRLELKRRLMDIGGRLSRERSLSLQVDADWESLPKPLDDSTAFHLADLAEALSQAIVEGSHDEIGRLAWSTPRTLLIVHQRGASLSATRDGERLRLDVDLETAPARPLKEELTRVLNATL